LAYCNDCQFDLSNEGITFEIINLSPKEPMTDVALKIFCLKYIYRELKNM